MTVDENLLKSLIDSNAVDSTRDLKDNSYPVARSCFSFTPVNEPTTRGVDVYFSTNFDIK